MTRENYWTHKIMIVIYSGYINVLLNYKHMKHIILFLAVILMSSSVWSQANENGEEIKTIFKTSENQTNGGYGGIMLNYSQIADRDAIVIGAKGAWIINHSFAIGLGGNAFITEPVYDVNLLEKYEFAGGYGGLLLEPIIGAKNPVHISFPILIGAGGITYNNHYGDDNDDDWNNEWEEDGYEDSDAFFVIEPGIEIEFNLVKFMRFALTGSYRYTSNIGLEYRSDNVKGQAIGKDDILRGWNIGLCMKFGRF